MLVWVISWSSNLWGVKVSTHNINITNPSRKVNVVSLAWGQAKIQVWGYDESSSILIFCNHFIPNWVELWEELSYVGCFLACYYMILSISVLGRSHQANRRKLIKCGSDARGRRKMPKYGELEKQWEAALTVEHSEPSTGECPRGWTPKSNWLALRGSRRQSPR